MTLWVRKRGRVRGAARLCSVWRWLSRWPGLRTEIILLVVQALSCDLLTGGWIRRESKSTASTVTEAWGPFQRFHFNWPGAQPRRREVQPLQEILW